MHTLEDLMVIYGDDMLFDLKVIGLADIIDGIEFLHNNGDMEMLSRQMY